VLEFGLKLFQKWKFFVTILFNALPVCKMGF
jgi:hypothetical protein